MHQAVCTVDGQTYNALDFSALSPIVIGALRGHFQCPECRGPAHFRRASSSGKGPCFVGRPHADGCELSTGTDDPWGEEGDRVVNRMEADQSRIILAIASSADDISMAATRPRNGAGGSRFIGGVTPTRTRIQRGPRRLLEWLVHTAGFRTSSIPIVLPDGTELAASSFFVHFSQAKGALHAGLYRGFWGVPNSLRIWERGGLTYLNAVPGRDLDSLSIYIPDSLHAAICGKFRLAQLSDLVRKQTLFIGVARLSTGQKFTLDLSSISSMAVIDP